MAAWPVIGLYWSLRCRLYLTALLATFVAGLGVPWLVNWVLSFVAAMLGRLVDLPEWSWSLTLILLALLCAWLLRRHLQRRAFAFHA